MQNSVIDNTQNVFVELIDSNNYIYVPVNQSLDLSKLVWMNDGFYRPIDKETNDFMVKTYISDKSLCSRLKSATATLGKRLLKYLVVASPYIFSASITLLACKLTSHYNTTKISPVNNIPKFVTIDGTSYNLSSLLRFYPNVAGNYTLVSSEGCISIPKQNLETLRQHIDVINIK